MPSGRFAIVPIEPVETSPVIDPAILGDGTIIGTVEAARRLKCSKPELYRLMDSGAIPFIQDGPLCRRRIPLAGFLAYQASRLRKRG